MLLRQSDLTPVPDSTSSKRDDPQLFKGGPNSIRKLRKEINTRQFRQNYFELRVGDNNMVRHEVRTEEEILLSRMDQSPNLFMLIKSKNKRRHNLNGKTTLQTNTITNTCSIIPQTTPSSTCTHDFDIASDQYVSVCSPNESTSESSLSPYISKKLSEELNTCTTSSSTSKIVCQGGNLCIHWSDDIMVELLNY